MKVKFVLSSSFISPKQEEYNYNNPIEIDWKLPFLPRLNEFVDMDLKEINIDDIIFNVNVFKEYVKR